MLHNVAGPQRRQRCRPLRNPQGGPERHIVRLGLASMKMVVAMQRVGGGFNGGTTSQAKHCDAEKSSKLSRTNCLCRCKSWPVGAALTDHRPALGGFDCVSRVSHVSAPTAALSACQKSQSSPKILMWAPGLCADQEGPLRLRKAVV